MSDPALLTLNQKCAPFPPSEIYLVVSSRPRMDLAVDCTSTKWFSHHDHVNSSISPGMPCAMPPGAMLQRSVLTCVTNLLRQIFFTLKAHLPVLDGLADTGTRREASVASIHQRHLCARDGRQHHHLIHVAQVSDAENLASHLHASWLRTIKLCRLLAVEAMLQLLFTHSFAFASSDRHLGKPDAQGQVVA